jgi:hypothetical protein
MHSVLIPHRNRNTYLRLCVWSICRSAQQCGIDDYEVIAVDSRSDQQPTSAGLVDALKAAGIERPHVRVLNVSDEMPILNKSALYNRGIDAAGTVAPAPGVAGLACKPCSSGSKSDNMACQQAMPPDVATLDGDGARQPQGDDVLTFIDCDAVAGAEWMMGAKALADGRITRLCYRVRYPRQPDADAVLADWPLEARKVDDVFARYDSFRLGYEAYGDPDRNHPARRTGRTTKRVQNYWGGALNDDGRHNLTEGEDNPQGNSQFSIRRDALGDIRYDEEYVGRGFGDLDVNRRIYAAAGKSYRGAIDYRPARNLLHLPHGYQPDWRTSQTHQANRTRYRELKKKLAK